MSVLDVGGEGGELAAFIGDVHYFLAEPKVNEISGLALPFPDERFDYVVSCHVLEHLPNEQRATFLDQLLAKSRRGVILLNPVFQENAFVEERLQLFVDITGAEWAKEHLDCTLPRLEEIRAFAESRGIAMTMRPSGSLATSLALVFVDHFASKCRAGEDLKKLNRFLNTRLVEIEDSPGFPVGYLIYFAKTSASDCSG